MVVPQRYVTPLYRFAGPGLQCAVRCSLRPERSLIRVSTFRCHVFSGTDYYMAAGGTHGGTTGTCATAPAGMTDIGADCSGGMILSAVLVVLTPPPCNTCSRRPARSRRHRGLWGWRRCPPAVDRPLNGEHHAPLACSARSTKTATLKAGTPTCQKKALLSSPQLTTSALFLPVAAGGACTTRAK
eukprot:scaffold72998_cov65-Phaeocystis_antarctica.AAC.9